MSPDRTDSGAGPAVAGAPRSSQGRSSPGASGVSTQASLESEISRIAGAAHTTLRREQAQARQKMEASSPAGPKAAARRQRLFVIGTALLGISLILTGVNVAGPGLFAERIPVPTPLEREEMLGKGMVFVVNAVRGWQSDNGSLPASLESAGIFPYEELTYERHGNESFRLSGSDGEIRLAFDSASDRGAFLARYGDVR